MKLIGIALIVVGVLALALGGIRYTTREKVLDLGPIEATTEKHKMIPLSPIVGIAAVVGGIAVLVVGLADARVGRAAGPIHRLPFTVSARTPRRWSSP